MNEVIKRKKLISIICDRLDNVLTEKQVAEAVDVIIEYIKNILIKQDSLSIENFGTFSTALFHGHNGIDVNTRLMQWVEPRFYIKFIASANFRKLINNQRPYFKIKEEQNG